MDFVQRNPPRSPKNPLKYHPPRWTFKLHRACSTPRWPSSNLDYVALKTLLETYTEKDQLHREQIKRKYVEKSREKFINEFIDNKIVNEVEKIENFYADQVTKNARLWQEGIRDKARYLFNVQNDYGVDESYALKGSEDSNKHKMKRLICEFYMSLVMLANFGEINETGLRKILKKFDKNVYNDSEGLLVESDKRAGKVKYKSIGKNKFCKAVETKELIEKVEKLMIDIEGGDRGKAMAKLRVPDWSKDSSKEYPTARLKFRNVQECSIFDKISMFF